MSKKKDKPGGLEAWLPPKGAPHIYAYSNLLRWGVDEKTARKTIEDQLKKAGIKK